MIMIRLSDIPEASISDHDLAAIAEWASKQKHLAFRDPQAAKCYAMFREAADKLLRVRTLSKKEQL